VSFAAEKLIDYFEVLVVSEGKTIAIGVSGEKFVTTKLPGADVNSYGYYADGKKYMYVYLLLKASLDVLNLCKFNLNTGTVSKVKPMDLHSQRVTL